MDVPVGGRTDRHASPVFMNLQRVGHAAGTLVYIEKQRSNFNL